MSLHVRVRAIGRLARRHAGIEVVGGLAELRLELGRHQRQQARAAGMDVAAAAARTPAHFHLARTPEAQPGVQLAAIGDEGGLRIVRCALRG